jgi:hypothetical protein
LNRLICFAVAAAKQIKKTLQCQDITVIFVAVVHGALQESSVSETESDMKASVQQIPFERPSMFKRLLISAPKSEVDKNEVEYQRKRKKEMK